MTDEKYKVSRELLEQRKADLLLRTTQSHEKAYRIIRKLAAGVFGYKVKKEHILTPYIIDIWIKDLCVGIELDGSVHNEVDGYDNRRDSYLWEWYGAKIYRFENDIVETLEFRQAIWDILIGGLDAIILKTASKSERLGLKINSKHFNPIPSLAKSC